MSARSSSAGSATPRTIPISAARSPGSTSGDADSLFQEGIRIPIVKICKEGKFNDDVLKLLLGNTRTPDERRGDLTAQVSANIIGAQKLQAAYEKYQDTLLDCMAEMLDYTDRLMRDAISKIPDGEYKYVDYVDGCGTLYPTPSTSMSAWPSAARK